MTMEKDILTEARVRKYLPAALPLTAITVVDEIPSTNTALCSLAREGAPHGTVLIAASQSAGRGRRGRSFFSPDGTGLYISVLLRPMIAAERAVRITTAAAVAAADAIADTVGAEAQIKWVNDLFLEGKKVAGILTESALGTDGNLAYAVLGIGINVAPPAGGFPAEIADIAGAILPVPIEDGRARLAASFLTHFFRRYEEIADDVPAYMEEYRRRCFVIGQRVEVIRGEERYCATALCVDDDAGLVVRRDDGTKETLSSGEISVRRTDMQEGQNAFSHCGSGTVRL